MPASKHWIALLPALEIFFEVSKLRRNDLGMSLGHCVSPHELPLPSTMYLDPNPLVLVVHKAKYGQVPSLRVPIVAQFTQFGFNMLYLYLLYMYIQLYSYHFNSFHIYSSGLPNEGSSCCERGGQRLDAQWPLHKAGGGLRFLPLGPGCWAWWFDHVDRLTIGLDRWWSLRE